MTLEEFLNKVYGIAMTPLPEGPTIDLAKYLEMAKEKWKGLPDVNIPELPKAPLWVEDFAPRRRP